MSDKPQDTPESAETPRKQPQDRDIESEREHIDINPRDPGDLDINPNPQNKS